MRLALVAILALGCSSPEPAPRAPVDGGTRAALAPRSITLAGTIEFQFDRPTVRPESLYLLDAAARVLEAHPYVTIAVECHTDGRGAPDYNLRLMADRAEEVRRYIANRGVAMDRMKATGIGPPQVKSHPSPLPPRHCELRRTDVP